MESHCSLAGSLEVYYTYFDWPVDEVIHQFRKMGTPLNIAIINRAVTRTQFLIGEAGRGVHSVCTRFQKRACSSGVGLDTGRQRTRRASPLLPEGVVASATSAGHGAELRCGGGFLPGSGGAGQLLGLLLQSPRGGFELRPPRPHSRFRI